MVKTAKNPYYTKWIPFKHSNCIWNVVGTHPLSNPKKIEQQTTIFILIISKFDDKWIVEHFHKFL